MAASKISIGNTYGERVVLSRVGTSPRGLPVWRTVCSCGTEADVTSRNLLRSNSCGCKKGGRGGSRRRRFPPGEVGLRTAYFWHKSGAHRRGIQQDLTLEQYRHVVTQECTYCGAPPSTTTSGTDGSVYTAFAHNGVDRADNTLGYTVSNSVPCCPTCNMVKRDLSVQDFLAWAARVHYHTTDWSR